MSTLEHLGFLGAKDSRHVFVTLSDRKVCTAKDRLARVYKGTLAAFEDQLNTMQTMGAGVFVQVNPSANMTSRRRLAAHVVEARNIFLDFDKDRLPILPCEPSMIIRTRNGYHCYWKIEPESDISAWRQTVKGMARSLGADLACTAPNQLGRLAGFFHQKKLPFLVEIQERNDRIYRLEDFHDFALPPVKTESLVDASIVRKLDFALRRQILNNAIAKCRAALEGERFTTHRMQAYHLGHFASYGIPLAYSLDCLVESARRWSDNLEKLRRDTIDMLQDGYQDSLIYRPHIPNQQIINWSKEDARTEYLSYLRSAALPNCLCLDDILSTYGDWEVLYESPRQAKVAISKELAEIGYVRIRTHSRGVRQLLYIRNTCPKPLPSGEGYYTT